MDADVDAVCIADDCDSEDGDALNGEDNVLSEVHTKRTAVNKNESEEELLLTREAVVRFDQDSIADATDI
uniref:Uncharacterized protein n=1 Tax=Peronospora matthiolae TaxID=2874970 RepID=A0AAV1VPE7_9STRA